MVILHPPQDPALYHLLSRHLRVSPDTSAGRNDHRQLLTEKENEALQHIISFNPKCAETKYPFDSIVRLGSVRPIYAALIIGASFEVIELLCDRYPSALLDRSACGWTPLHAAIAYNAPFPPTIQAASQ